MQGGSLLSTCLLYEYLTCKMLRLSAPRAGQSHYTPIVVSIIATKGLYRVRMVSNDFSHASEYTGTTTTAVPVLALARPCRRRTLPCWALFVRCLVDAVL